MHPWHDSKHCSHVEKYTILFCRGKKAKIKILASFYWNLWACHLFWILLKSRASIKTKIHKEGLIRAITTELTTAISNFFLNNNIRLEATSMFYALWSVDPKWVPGPHQNCSTIPFNKWNFSDRNKMFFL